MLYEVITFDDDKKKPAQPSNLVPPTGGASQSPSPSPSATSPSPSAAPPSAGPSAVPSPAPSTSATPSAPASGQPGSTPTAPPAPYFVVDGDSLWVIAQRHRDTLLDAAHVPAADRRTMPESEQALAAFREILQLNPSAARDPAHLPIGKPLNVG